MKGAFPSHACGPLRRARHPTKAASRYQTHTPTGIELDDKCLAITRGAQLIGKAIVMSKSS